MSSSYSKKFGAIALLFFCLAHPCLAEGADADAKSRGSAGVEADAAKNYLSLQGSASLETHKAALSSIDLNYDNSRSGSVSDTVKTWSLALALNDQGKIFDGSLGISYANDDQTRSGLGAKLAFGATWEYHDGFEAGLSLSGGPTRYSASEGSTVTAGALKKRSVNVDNSVAITQWNPSADLSLSFFDGTLSASASGTRFRYQNYKTGSGLAGSAEQSAAAAGLKNTLVGGFIDWEWNLSARLNLPWNIGLSGCYTESLDLDSQNWSKSLEGDLSKDFGKSFNAMAGLVHATEGGSGDNTIKAGLTYNF